MILPLRQDDQAMLKINLTAQLAQAIGAQHKKRDYALATAKGVLESIELKDLRALPLKERWFYHHVAADLIGGSHKSLAVRGKKLILAEQQPTSQDVISHARMLLRLKAKV